MKKWGGIFLLIVAGGCLAASLFMSVKVRSFPNRLNYEQGQVLHRMMRLWLGSLASTGAAGIVLVAAGRGRLSNRVGWGCIFTAPVLFLLVPNSVHSITSAKNACINNLRQIDGVKEEWEMTNRLEGRGTVSMADLGAVFTGSKSEMSGGWRI